VTLPGDIRTGLGILLANEQDILVLTEKLGYIKARRKDVAKAFEMLRKLFPNI
jgi:hypothetical protein